MKKLLILLVLTVMATGCEYIISNEFLLMQEEISLSWRNAVQIKYDEAGYQISFNDRDIEYRIYDDNLANWFTIRCSEKPEVVEQMITADVEWTGSRSTKSFTRLEFTVEKTSEDGLIWLYNTSNNIGIVIKNIQ